MAARKLALFLPKKRDRSRASESSGVMSGCSKTDDDTTDGFSETSEVSISCTMIGFDDAIGTTSHTTFCSFETSDATVVCAAALVRNRMCADHIRNSNPVGSIDSI